MVLSIFTACKRVEESGSKQSNLIILDGVEFEDQALVDCIEYAKDVFEVSDLVDLERLYCKGADISSVKGLQSMSGLTTLQFDDLSVTSLDLQMFQSLLYFTINGQDNPIDLKFGLHPSLEGLVLRNAKLTSDLNLTGLPKLRQLIIRNSDLNSLDLSQNLALETLDLRGNNLSDIVLPFDISLEDGSEVAGNSLERVLLSQNPLSDATRAYLQTLDEMLAIDVNTPKTLFGVEFEDQNFGFCVREALRKLSITELSDLSQLSCFNKEITSVNGLQSLTGLKELDLARNAIQLIDLTTLTQLESLSLGAALLTSLDLSSNSALLKLSIWGSPLIEALDLSGNTELTSLDLSDNDKLDPKAVDLSQNKKLTNLNLFDNDGVYLNDDNWILGRYFSDPVFASCVQSAAWNFQELGEISQLTCSRDEPFDVSELVYLKNLERLVMDSSQLSTLDLRELDSLKVIEIGSNFRPYAFTRESRLSLSELLIGDNPTLESLIVRGSELETLDLSGAINLKFLDLEYNRIRDIDLKTNTKLVDINLRANALTTINLVANNNIEIVGVGQNPLTEETIGALTNHPRSAVIDVTTPLVQHDIEFVDRNFIYCVNRMLRDSDITSIAELTRLECDFFGIKDLIGIEALTNLRFFSSWGNNLTDLTLTNPNLTILYLTGNSLNSLDIRALSELEVLGLADDTLTGINLTQNLSLQQLSVWSAPLFTHLDISANSALELLNLGGSKLSELDISHNPQLWDITLRDNALLTDYGLYVSGVFFEDHVFAECIMAALEQLNSDSIESILTLDCSNRNLSSVSGIAHLQSLDKLVVRRSSIERMDVSGASSLRVVEADGNQLREFVASDNSTLEDVDLNNNNLVGVDLSGAENLLYLDVSRNPIDSLDLAANTNLYAFSLYETPNLVNLDLSSNADLRYFQRNDDESKNVTFPIVNVGGVSFKDFYFGSCVKFSMKKEEVLELSLLKTIHCSGLGIESLEGFELLTGLENVHISQLGVDYIDFNNQPNVIEVSFDGGSLEVIDLSGAPLLEVLVLKNNSLKAINLNSNTHLRYVNLLNNDLTGIEFDNHPELKMIALNYNPLSANTMEYLSGYDSSVLIDITASLNILGVEFEDVNLAFCLRYKMQVQQITNLDQIENFGCTETGISNTKGIESLTNVEYLYLWGNEISEIDLSENTNLREVFLGTNPLTSVNLNGITFLEVLYLNDTPLNSIDLSQLYFLKRIYLFNSSISEIDLTDQDFLEVLSIGGNPLASDTIEYLESFDDVTISF